MTAFLWTDARGERIELDSPAPIEAEIETINRQIDRMVNALNDEHRATRDAVRAGIDALEPRLKRLQGDLIRWNIHATAVTRAEAARLLAHVEQLPAMIADATLVVALHDERDALLERTAATPDIRANALAAPMTVIQRRAITACASPDAPIQATRGEAHGWLDRQPRFARRPHDDTGWFAWTDRHGHAHRLADALMIEREAVMIASELAGLRADLVASAPIEAVCAALAAGVGYGERLQILQHDLDRFERVADARDLAACRTYAADWRSKRNGK